MNRDEVDVQSVQQGGGAGAVGKFAGGAAELVAEQVQDPNALNGIFYKNKSSVLLRSDFRGLRVDQASLVEDVILSYYHQIA